MCNITIVYLNRNEEVSETFAIEDDIAYNLSVAAKSKDNKALKKLFSYLYDVEGDIHCFDINSIQNFNLEQCAN